MKALQVLPVLVKLLTLCHAIQTEYFVKPNESTPCSEPLCHTLSHHLAIISLSARASGNNTVSLVNTTQYTSNTKISFLPGVHKIDTMSVLYIVNVTNLTLAGYNVSTSHAARIVCNKPASLMFSSIVNLVIKHLSIIYCGSPIVTLKYRSEKKWSSVAVLLQYITSLMLSEISVENSTGYGILGRNIFGNSSVSHSRFIFSNYYTLSSTNCSYGLGSCMGGNMLLFYSESAVNITGSNSVLSIDSCVFSDGVDTSNGRILTFSGGLAIHYRPNQLLNLDISISNVVSTRNVGKEGANFYFILTGGNVSLNITNTTSSMANHILKHELCRTGFKFQYHEEMDPSIQVPSTNQTLLHISNSKFYDNNGGVSIQLHEVYNNVRYHMIIKNCSFLRNMNPTASGLAIGQVQLDSISGLEVLVQDTSFTNHLLPEKNVRTSKRFNVVAVYNLKHVKIINCTFAMNGQTALQVFGSTLYFGGHVIFSGNNGRLGGALLLQRGSRFNLMPHTHIQIFNNHAKRGGGIYVEDDAAVTKNPCFFQLMHLHFPYSDIDSVITLENNTADEAGSALYGGDIDNCQLYASSKAIIENGTVNAVFAALFRILALPSFVSQVSSNPLSVHVCNHRGLVTSEIHGVQVYPGQAFRVPIVLYGQQNGSVPGIVYANLVNKSRDARLAPLQETQETGYVCKNLTYTVFSTGNFELIQLGVDDVQYYYPDETQVQINVTLLPCPPGFQLSNITAQCECAPMLQDRGLLCNISGATPLVQRTRSTWISTHHNGSDIILHDHCPLNYCKPTQLWLRLDHPDEQCAQRRSSILCGKCNSNFSLTVGTSKCLEEPWV